MKIEWVNHASFVLQHEDIRLISDPWIEGRVFNESWAHLSESKFKFEDFSGITHIWFSHEHPDHFFPPNIKKIPSEYRSKITVLFQNTKDMKVAEFCRNSGFKAVIELDEGVSYQLNKTLAVTNGKVKNDTDSWLYIQTPDCSILNLNDCVFSDEELSKLGSLYPKVDVLLTQFSFASWVGNKNDVAEIRRNADLKRKEIEKHIAVFSPKYTIPFASFVWFCHQDNFHLNELSNDIESITHWIKSLDSHPVVLYPGDVWDLSEQYDSESAIKLYNKDKADLAFRKLTRFDTVDFNELNDVANKFVKRGLERNNKAKLLSYNPMFVYLTDHQQAYSFSYKNGLEPVEREETDSDVSFHSQNLLYCLKFDWGFDTILVAATFEKPENGDFQNFMEYEWVATLNNQGKTMKGLVGRILDRIAT